MKHEMKSLSEILANRVNEESLQQILEAMIYEIKRMKLGKSDEKKILSMLMSYRSAWNTYLSTLKGKPDGREANDQMGKFIESKKR